MPARRDAKLEGGKLDESAGCVGFGRCTVGFVLPEHTLDKCLGRAAVRPCRQRFHCLGRAADLGFDAAVAAVAHPAGKSRFFRFACQLPAESDALDASVDGQTTGQRRHAYFVCAIPGAMAARMPCISCSGVGGQPGMATSTGMTLETRPQEA